MRFDFWEIVGFIASTLVVLAMCFKTTTHRGEFFMRLFDMLGSAINSIYAICTGATSVLYLNGILVIVNAFYLYKNVKSKD